MDKFQQGLTFSAVSISSLLILAGLVFIIGFSGLSYYKFFAPKYANVERQVFENTKSFTHGKVQDLAKYYEEYNKSTEEEKESIRQLIIMNFSDFNSNNIKNNNLKMFLISQRGY